jgi:hypothetical protein
MLMYNIYILFNGIVGNSDCIILNNLVISEQWIWKVVEWSWHGLIWFNILMFA